MVNKIILGIALIACSLGVATEAQAKRVKVIKRPNVTIVKIIR